MIDNPERMIGSGALAGVLGVHLPVLSNLPPEVRSAVFGAVGAALAGLVAKAGAALGDVVTASGRRVSAWIWPRKAVEPAPEAPAPAGGEA